ncbi:MAG: L-seryl-tRNA(Sec) selenium transferase [Actinomycetota bacterium]|nr:L-seryl-tRNA(Sec) selenium transferase [Actinomycetota bacterium]
MGSGNDSRAHELRALPAVHELAAALDAPHALAVRAARQAIDEQRDAMRSGVNPAADVTVRAREVLEELGGPRYRRVINATGVVIHTNLGRAPLPRAAREALAQAAEGYSNLELDLQSGERGSRQDHVEALLCELTGAEAALVVNNCAAAVLLAAAALGGPGYGIVVSRGQLVEIGGGFRVPQVIEQSGATLVEVGTTNRTSLEDYERALRAGTVEIRAILRVHQSNFRTLGFVKDVPVEDLCRLAVPVIDDLGSGVLADTGAIAALADEPPVKRSVAAGAALVCCSGDKLLGGPQAGLLVGRSDAVTAAREHPLARAIRIDKLSLAALEATLALYLDPERARREIPVLAMLDVTEATLRARAARLADAIGPDARLVRSTGRVGGGALPLLELEGPAVALNDANSPVLITQALRSAEPPVIARIHGGRAILDPRTIADEEIEGVAAAVRAALAGLAARR